MYKSGGDCTDAASSETIRKTNQIDNHQSLHGGKGCYTILTKTSIRNTLPGSSRPAKKLVASVDQTLLPENGLLARGLLDDAQLEKVRNIRTRRLSPVIRERFIAD